MNCDQLQIQLASHALGALDPAAAAELSRRLAEDAEARHELARLRDVVAALARVAVVQRPAPARVRARVLERIRRMPQSAAAEVSGAPPTRPPAPEGFSFVHDDAGWVPSGIPGIDMRLLAVNPKEGYRVILGRLAPGTRLPAHVHRHGPEELLVLTGDLVSGGRTLQAGDFVHADAGTDHMEVFSPNGCIALMIEPVEGAEAMLEHA